MSQVTGPLAGRRILLVEDEYMIAEIMEEWLCRAGAEVIGPVPSVKQALESLDGAAEGLDGAVLDVNLGNGETSYPIADKLLECGVPYLFATGDVQIINDPAYRERPHLEKPLAQMQLLRAVEKLLAIRSLRTD
jgi:CheY-like chemotaxis protein